ncbi:MAG: chemotaxis protein CheW [Anaerolineales bacterium]
MTEKKYQTLDLSIEPAIQRAISLGEELTEAQKQTLLEKRARLLAQPITAHDEQHHDTLRVLTFRIGDETYAFPAASVLSVNKSINITPVPNVPSFVAGITNLRGHIRSVVRLAEFLGMQHLVEARRARVLAEQSTRKTSATAPSPDDDYVVVAVHGDMEVAFIVSGLDEVTDIPTQEIKPRPANLNSQAALYMSGVLPGGLVLLDLEAIFTDERFIVNDDMAG